jgi:nitroreductase
MSELMKLIKSRRSIRSFKSKEVTGEDVDELLEAARWAPSGSNAQPVCYVVVTDRGTLQAIKMMSPGIFGEPPAMIVMCFRRERIQSESEYLWVDLGAALQNILLMAEVKGLGCCPIASFDPESVAELLSLPSHIQPVLLIIVGFTEANPTPPPRLPLKELVVRRL